MAWNQLRKFYQQKTPITYDEIPIMISQSGKLVCIDVDRDMPTIGIVGIRGSGKSRCLHSLVDLVYHKRKEDKLIILNDQHDETPTYAIKGRRMQGEYYNKEDDLWVKQLNSLGLKPMRLPIVHCYPAITDSYFDAPNNITKLQISLKHESLFKSEQLFDNNVAGSTKYFRLLKERLMRCKNYDELMSVFDEIDNKAVREKLKLLIANLFQEKIVSFDESIISKSFFLNKNKNEKVIMHILMALMASRCIPALMTRSIQNSKYYTTYLRMIIEDLFDNQKKGWFAKNQINSWLFIDELTGLDSIGEKPNDMTQILQRTVTEGRPSRIATVWATQNYVKVRDKIRTNTRYLISFRLNTDEEVKTIMRDFSLTESQAESIKKLDKERFECVAITSEYFTTYDLKTGEKSQISGFIRGYSIPSLSMHKQPEFNMPKSNIQYAIMHLKEKNFRIGNDKTNTVVLGDFTHDLQNHMKYDELGDTTFYPEDFDIRLFAPKGKEIVTITYDELKTFGWQICCHVTDPRYRLFRQQRITYELGRIGNIPKYSNVLNYCPKDCVIEMNPVDMKIRLKSPNISRGVTGWCNIYGD